MAKEMAADLERALDIAERERTCYVGQDDRERRALNRQVDKKLVRPCPGIFSRVETWEGMEPDEQALWVVRGLAGQQPDIRFCGPSAALVHGLDVPWRSLRCAHAAGTHDSTARSTQGIVRHEITASEFITIDGVTVTTFDRTVADCLRWLPFDEALAVADSALKVSGMSCEELEEVVSREAFRLKGKARALEVARWADARSDNAGESLARGAMIRLGFEAPELQVELRDPVEGWRRPVVDFAWFEGGDRRRPIAFGELDGYRKTENPRYMGGRSAERVRTDERRRESRISVLGVPIVRFSLAEASDDWGFSRLLQSYGIPFRGAD